ncbi:GAF domain-containing sensor histidine kinase [Boudabousia tangfeifanii]|uniref:GAF domain-containing sensor histidine kinase n=1 Tax=Boudabousia tangfeifanii TaxID=1912795 RepID=UPI0009F6F8F1|nr:GAF domain-containing protein [Boudabousia tangfeifanii]
MKLDSQSELLKASLNLASKLDVTEVLQGYVDLACELTNAELGALSVINARGQVSLFVDYQMPPDFSQEMKNSTVGASLLEVIGDNAPLIENEVVPEKILAELPKTLPKIDNYMGFPLQVSHRVFGWLYLANREGGFTQAHANLVRRLGRAAAIAVENAQLYERAQTRERWIAASNELTTMLLSGSSVEDALETTVDLIQNVAEADGALLILPSVGKTWACEFVAGDDFQHLLGVVFPHNGRAMTVARTGQGVTVDCLASSLHLKVPQLAEYGPALYAPMRAHGQTTGVFLLLRNVGGKEFTKDDLKMAHSTASQAALALELAEAKHLAQVATLQAEREQIGRDLHDLAIQQLFATGMQLASLKDAFVAAIGSLDQKTIEQAGIDNARLTNELETALERVGDSADQIRQIVRRLRNNDGQVQTGILERLQHEASLARSSLGFAPTFIVELDGKPVKDEVGYYEVASDIFNERIGAVAADDLIAVVRESLANAAKHAKATSVRVTISLRPVEGKLSLEVSDNGIGLPENRTRNSGLDNMRKRANIHGGIFTTEKNLLGGTTLYWEIKL